MTQKKYSKLFPAFSRWGRALKTSVPAFARATTRWCASNRRSWLRRGLRAAALMWLLASVVAAFLPPPSRIRPPAGFDLPTFCNPVLDAPGDGLPSAGAADTPPPPTRWLDCRRPARPFLDSLRNDRPDWPRFAFSYPVPAGFVRRATGRGRAFRRLAVRSPGAAAVRILLRDVNLPPGVELRIYGRTRSPNLPEEVHAGRGPFGDGELWSNLVPGDTVFLEWSRDLDFMKCPPLRPAAVTHFLPEPALGFLADCFENAACRPTREMRAAVRLLYQKERRTPDGRIKHYPGLQSGVLLATPEGDYAPLVATAAHGVSSAAVARSVQAFWGYQADGCRGGGLSAGWRASPTGARLAALSPHQDLALLEILGVTPRGLCYGGWTTEPPVVGEKVFTYHFPGAGLPVLNPWLSWLRVTVGAVTHGIDIDVEALNEFLDLTPYRRGEIVCEGGGVLEGTSGAGLWRYVAGRPRLTGVIAQRHGICNPRGSPMKAIAGLFGPLTHRMVEQFVLETSPGCAPIPDGNGDGVRRLVVTQSRPATVVVRLGSPGRRRVRVYAPRVFGDVGVEVSAVGRPGAAPVPVASRITASPVGETAVFESSRPGEIVLVRLFLRNDTRAVADVVFERWDAGRVRSGWVVERPQTVF